MPKEHKYELINHSEEDTFLISILNSKRESVMKKMHVHDHYELTIFKSFNKKNSKLSSFEYYIENLKYTINSSLFMLVPPKEKHMTTRPKYTQRIIINFREDFGRGIFEFLNIDMDLFFRKHILTNTAKRAGKIFRQVFKLCSRSYTHIRCALFFVINPAASITYIFFHINTS